MEHYEPTREMETQEPGSKPTGRENPMWRVRPRTWERITGPGEHINAFRQELQGLPPFCDMNPPPDRPLKVQLFEEWVVVDLTKQDLICLFFDIPSTHTEKVDVRYAIDKSKEIADKIPRNNVCHLVYPLTEVPEGKQRICFMFETFNFTQSEVLDKDLEEIFAGVKKVLDKQGGEDRTKVLPIVWEKRYVFTVGQIEDIKTWGASPSNIGAIPLESSPSSPSSS